VVVVVVVVVVVMVIIINSHIAVDGISGDIWKVELSRLL